ncbi:ribonuclease R family protein, partial [Malonomonas rubra]|uniref:ribonuclease R family protein n=1 Tax=Malonomonas rubra TaxID=57040 RepID=UPI0026EF9278
MLEKKLCNLFKRYPHKSLQRRDIAEILNLHGGERKQLTAILRKMVSDGMVELKKGRYRQGQQTQAIQGTFSLAERGYGFVRPEISQREDLFIPEKSVADAMHGDLVSAQQLGFDRSGRPYGKIIKILQRAHRSVLGIYHQQRGRAWVVPLDQYVAKTVYVRMEGSIDAEPGQVVRVEFLRYPSAKSAGSGRVVEVLGDQDDPQVDIETVIRTYELPRYFSMPALVEAESVATGIVPEDLTDRTDLRGLPLVTIDGETAKDFDDAVALRQEEEGKFRLWVCIADVAHYVTTKGALDGDARERGTSIYFPGYCLPMLPENLSNGICSLNPHEDRLVMAVELLFDNRGHCVKADFYPAVMRSAARLTYTEVANFLSLAEKTNDLPVSVAEQLPLMAELAGLLGKMRRERGCLELDVPDVEIELDESGFPRAVSKTKRTIAHRLIEEFMLAANEAVADFLEKRNYSFLYRVHEQPTLDKLQEFQQLAAECGVGLVLQKNLQREIQRLLDEIAERPEARLLNQQLLRSLQQAQYTPLNKGHFGLAAQSYCHFTSPIRRYPDLQVHRT